MDGPVIANRGARARRPRRGRWGLDWCTNGSGTNSVNPPVSRWIAARVCRWVTQWPGWSTWPYIIVLLVGRPIECAVVTTSIHRAVGSLPFVKIQRTSSSRISAAVPGSESNTGLLGGHQEVADRQAGASDPVHDLHRRERVHMEGRCGVLDCSGDVEVRRSGQLGVDPALHADLRRAHVNRLNGAGGDLVQRERVGVGVGLALREGAEPAAGVADVGEVDVAVDHICDLVADRVAPKVVGQSRTLPPGSGPPPRSSVLGRVQATVSTGWPQPLGEPRRHHRPVGCGLDVARQRSRSTPQSPYTSSKSPRFSCDRPVVSIDSCRSVLTGADEGSVRPAAVGLLPWQPGCDSGLVGQPVGPAQSVHVDLEPGI